MNENPEDRIRTECSTQALALKLLLVEEEFVEVRQQIIKIEASRARLVTREGELCQEMNDLNKLRGQLEKFGRGDLFTA